VSAIPPTLAYRTPPSRRPQRLPWNIAAVAWAHVAMGGVMVLLARPHVRLMRHNLVETMLTLWLVTTIAAPFVVGGAILLGQQRFIARLIAALMALPLLLAELLLGLCGLLLIAVNSYALLIARNGYSSRAPLRVTVGIVVVAVAALLVGLTAALIRYISKPCDRPTTAILPT
jgi:hypothetical protein